jgi:hypothetical protein
LGVYIKILHRAAPRLDQIYNPILVTMARTALRASTAKSAVVDVVDVEASDPGEPMRPHPLQVRPEGNAFTDRPPARPPRDHAGLFRLLPDELLARLLEHLDARSLCTLGATCKLLHAFSRVDDLWRALFVASTSPHQQHIRWRGSWRATHLRLPLHREAHVSCAGLYSDWLYRPFFCAHTSLPRYARGIPRANRIARLPDLTPDEYARRWASEPFILTAPVRAWPAFGRWSTGAMLRSHGAATFRAEAVDWPLRTYVDYMRANRDESPLYLFDRSFASTMGVRTAGDGAEYEPPACFGEDLFALLGDARPDHRWLILGPPRSGSTFHKDPNATSAWNAVLTGSKYWIMFPSGPKVPPPPGVILSEDASEITSPLSIAEYLLNFHEVARATPGCREGVCAAGEVLHVPSGWFHLVLNLEESLAITQNFVPRRKLADVLRFLRDSPDQVSGFRGDVDDPYSLFVERLREAMPDVLDEALTEMDKAAQPKKRRWEEMTKVDDDEGGFSFGFSHDDD